jgi:hypothetical protein
MHCRRLDGELRVNCQVANTAALAGAELSGAENASGPGSGRIEETAGAVVYIGIENEHGAATFHLGDFEV